MHRYTLNINDREFVIDVQALTADRFEVVVGGDKYEVNLAGEEALAEATVRPDLQPVAKAAPRPASSAAAAVAKVRRESAAEQPGGPAVVAPPKPTGGGGGRGSLTSPMPGVIIEVNVKPGDQVKRGQQVAILDAMKMHNVIGAPRDGVVGEVFVAAGQAVDHGDAIIKFKED